jgi:hypothetical protein
MNFNELPTRIETGAPGLPARAPSKRPGKLLIRLSVTPIQLSTIVADSGEASGLPDVGTFRCPLAKLQREGGPARGPADTFLIVCFTSKYGSTEVTVLKLRLKVSPARHRNFRFESSLPQSA